MARKSAKVAPVEADAPQEAGAPEETPPPVNGEATPEPPAQATSAAINGTSAPDAELQAKLAATESELAATKRALKLVREERCLDALQAVLEKHRCQLSPLPNGQYQVVAVD